MSKRKYFKKTFLCRSCKKEFKDVGNIICIYCSSKNLSVIKYFYKRKRKINKNRDNRLVFCKECNNEFEYNKNQGLYKCPYCLGHTISFFNMSNLYSIKEKYPDTYMHELKMSRKLYRGMIKFVNGPTKQWLDFKKRMSQTQWGYWD